MFYDGWIKFFDETYLFLAVCVALNCNYLSWSTAGNAINSLATILLGSSLVVYPFFTAIFYTREANYRLISKRDEKFKDKFGSAIANLNILREGRSVLLYRPASNLRKLWLALMIVFMRTKPVICIFQVNFQSLIMMFVIG